MLTSSTGSRLTTCCRFSSQALILSEFVIGCNESDIGDCQCHVTTPVLIANGHVLREAVFDWLICLSFFFFWRKTRAIQAIQT